jgi:hypothetical protein
MTKPIKLLYKGEFAATLSNFGYATPFAIASATFQDESLAIKLIALTTMNQFGIELEEMDIPEAEEERLYDAKQKELNLSSDDYAIKNDKNWSVICEDGSIDGVRAIRFESDGFLEWRPGY